MASAASSSPVWSIWPIWSPMSWSADDVIAATGAKTAQGTTTHGKLEAEIVESVCTDTRRLKPGCLFVALLGPNHDGHRFAAAALRLGAVAVLLETIPAGVETVAP